jgi:hypothetical protein
MIAISALPAILLWCSRKRAAAGDLAALFYGLAKLVPLGLDEQAIRRANRQR